MHRSVSLLSASGLDLETLMQDASTPIRLYDIIKEKCGVGIRLWLCPYCSRNITYILLNGNGLLDNMVYWDCALN